MTLRQRAMKLFYPGLMLSGKLTGGKKGILENTDKLSAPVSFYTLTDTLINGRQSDFHQYRGKKVLLVNTASDCGYTPQYAELQKLQDMYPGQLFILGFPSGDFKDQEKGSDEEIAAFCIVNFGVHFTLMHKSHVRKNNTQNSVFKWLTHASQNGWNDNGPSWNFTKYLVNEQGILTHIFTAAISPTDAIVISAISR